MAPQNQNQNPKSGGDGRVAPQNQNRNAGVPPAKRPSKAAPAASEPKKSMVAGSGQARASIPTNKVSVGAGGGGVYTPIDSITPYQNKWQIKVFIVFIRVFFCCQLARRSAR